MKTSKRILGVALALIMIFNVFAVGTFAAGTESAVDLYLSTDKAVYAAGEEIVLTVSAQAIPAVGNLRIGGQYAIGYDASAIKPLSDSLELADHGVTALQAGYDASISGIVDKSFDALDTDAAANYGWTDWTIYGLADDAVTSFDASSKTDLFTFKMKVADDAADGTYTIGFNKASYETYNGYIADVFGYSDDYGYGTTANYGFNNVTITVGEAAAEPKVEHVDTMGQMQGGWDTLTGPFNGGFVGKISNLDLTFDGNECTNLLKIEVTLNGQSAEAYQVYEQADGSYLFRAVVKGMDITSTDNITAVYTIHVDTNGDGAADKTYSSEAIDTNAKAIYEEALGEYQKTL